MVDDDEWDSCSGGIMWIGRAEADELGMWEALHRNEYMTVRYALANVDMSVYGLSQYILERYVDSWNTTYIFKIARSFQLNCTVDVV